MGTFSLQFVTDPGLSSSAFVPLLSFEAFVLLGFLLLATGTLALWRAHRFSSEVRDPLGR